VLLDAVVAYHNRGWRVSCLGDFNVRIGALTDDVAAREGVRHLPGAEVWAAPPDGCVIPAARASADPVVHAEAAQHLLHGLGAAGAVVLDGRAPAGVLGSNSGLTCHNVRQGVCVGGGSVVDLGAVSRPLFASVQRFTVAPFIPLVSQDHSALLLVLHGVLAAPAAPAPAQPRVRVYRPEQVAYAAQLLADGPSFAALLRQWQQQGTSAAAAHDQLVELVQAAAMAAGAARRQQHRQPACHDRTAKPWYDEECRAAMVALRQAWEALRQATQQGGDVAAAHHGLVRARGAYRAVRRAKQAAHQQQQLLESYFGQRQRDFWRVFAGERPALTPAADARRWTAWFEQLLGQPAAPVQLDAQDALLQWQLFARLRTCGQAGTATLNALLSVDVVAAAMQLPRGKAADLQGLTGEALRAAAVADAGRPGGMVCGAFVECVRWLLQRVFDGDALPAPMRVSKLVPVPKPGQAAAPRDMHLYRGICVSSVLSRVWDRVLFRRLNNLAERQGLRAPAKCGFRPGHGTLDAVYTLQHVCDSYRAQRRPVYAVSWTLPRPLILLIGGCCWSAAGRWAYLVRACGRWRHCTTTCCCGWRWAGRRGANLPAMWAPSRAAC
jgi:hypothetical protein